MKEKYLEDLEQIKDIMNRSSRFISLSGISGVSVGIIALFGAWLSHEMVFSNQSYLTETVTEIPASDLNHLLMIALATLVLSALAAIFFTTRETRIRGEKVWDHQARKLIVSLMTPLLAGGLTCLLLLYKGMVGPVLALTLVFYGLSLINASKYTLNEIRTLGLVQILFGLLALQFPAASLMFWALGFGVSHITIGLLIKFRPQL